ncbi:DUF2059 domain-containing protein [Maliponia aquimaris]|uniref:Uncharacterized protein n=1 Tax=Maliponia aquimaris TaxID=1673631 RepID=A0A238KQB0_9RHOB|nr:DUF2059 domain-containing protein [Maliponia aquimaris]SMX45003.1 hypothetical protein MAA8898_03117 [Maliponia aquimaris]
MIHRTLPVSPFQRMLAGVLALICVVAMALPARAEPVGDLMRALKIDSMLQIMREEGLAYGGELAGDILPGGGTRSWTVQLDEIYDIDRMRGVVSQGMSGVLAEADPDPLVAFFTSELGARIIGLELSAREAMIDDAVEEAARQTYRQMKDKDDPRLAQIARFIEVNDLLEANVAGALNASFRFYSGLVDGGGLAMTESEILADVWAQEEETRDDTREWLNAFLLLAYEPLSDDELEAYIALSETVQGRVLNRALFSGFNAMYDEISYALGLAAARQMQQQEL